VALSVGGLPRLLVVSPWHSRILGLEI
jgi:hypothetical protein